MSIGGGGHHQRLPPSQLAAEFLPVAAKRNEDKGRNFYLKKNILNVCF